MTMPLHEKNTTLITHAETLADEAADAGLHEISDHLRLSASRLAIDGELVDVALRVAATTHRRRVEAMRRLSAFNHRIELEMAARFPRDVAAAYLASARVSPKDTACFRLRRFSTAHREALGDLVTGLEAAIGDCDLAIDESLAATAAAFVARAQANGRAYRLRLDCERSKAALLAVLPSSSAAAGRVRRRVVRTRRPDRAAFWRSVNSSDGVPVEG